MVLEWYGSECLWVKAQLSKLSITLWELRHSHQTSLWEKNGRLHIWLAPGLAADQSFIFYVPAIILTALVVRLLEHIAWHAVFGSSQQHSIRAGVGSLLKLYIIDFLVNGYSYSIALAGLQEDVHARTRCKLHAPTLLAFLAFRRQTLPQC